MQHASPMIIPPTSIRISDIYHMLDAISPFSLQEKWDNAGLNVGSMDDEVTSIALALELDYDIAISLAPNSLIITHHPLIFSAIKSINTRHYPANLLTILLQKSCALIAMHTNFDSTHLNEHFAITLGFTNTTAQGYARYCAIPETPLLTLVKNCKKALNLSHIRFSQGSDMVKHVYIVCGAGAFFARENLPPQSCLICGDVKYHDAMMARSQGISFIDAEHYASEKEFPTLLHSLLQIQHLSATIKPNFSPFSYL